VFPSSTVRFSPTASQAVRTLRNGDLQQMGMIHALFLPAHEHGVGRVTAWGAFCLFKYTLLISQHFGALALREGFLVFFSSPSTQLILFLSVTVFFTIALFFSTAFLFSIRGAGVERHYFQVFLRVHRVLPETQEFGFESQTILRLPFFSPLPFSFLNNHALVHDDPALPRLYISSSTSPFF